MNAFRKFLIVGCVAAFALASVPSAQAWQGYRSGSGGVHYGNTYGGPAIGYGGGPSSYYRYGGSSVGFGYPSGYYGNGLYQRGYGRGYYGPGNWNRGFVGPSNGFYGPGFGIRF